MIWKEHEHEIKGMKYSERAFSFKWRVLVFFTVEWWSRPEFRIQVLLKTGFFLVSKSVEEHEIFRNSGSINYYQVTLCGA